MSLGAFGKNFTWKKNNISIPPIIAFKESNTSVIWSTDLFNTFTRETVSAASWVWGNLHNFVAFSTSATTIKYTVDYGVTWRTANVHQYIINVVFDDSGQYGIIGGHGDNTSAYRFHRYTTDYGATWTDCPMTIYLNSGGYYGGNGCGISRNGKNAIFICRANSLGFNNNWLNSGSFEHYGRTFLGLGNNNAYGYPTFDPNNSKWVCSNSEPYVPYLFSGINTPQTSAQTAAFKSDSPLCTVYDALNNVFVIGDSTISYMKSINSSGGISTLFTSKQYLGFSDDGTITTRSLPTYGDFYINNTLQPYQIKGYNILRDGSIFILTTDFKIRYTNNAGTSWSDKTGTSSLTSSCSGMVQQTGRIDI